MVFNVVTWRVYWPEDRSDLAFFTVYTDAWHVVGTVLLKAGFAGAFFAGFFLANWARTERTAELW